MELVERICLCGCKNKFRVLPTSGQLYASVAHGPKGWEGREENKPKGRPVKPHPADEFIKHIDDLDNYATDDRDPE